MTARFAINPVHGMIDAIDLPALVGSEKQVAWAETIRLAKLARIATDFGNQYRKACETLLAAERPIPMTFEQAVEALNVKHADLLNDTSAAAWIDRR